MINFDDLERQQMLAREQAVIDNLPVCFRKAPTPPAPQPMTDEQIREIAVKYCAFVGDGKYDVVLYECDEDFFEFCRALLAEQEGK